MPGHVVEPGALGEPLDHVGTEGACHVVAAGCWRRLTIELAIDFGQEFLIRDLHRGRIFLQAQVVVSSQQGEQHVWLNLVKKGVAWVQAPQGPRSAWRSP